MFISTLQPISLQNLTTTQTNLHTASPFTITFTSISTTNFTHRNTKFQPILPKPPNVPTNQNKSDTKNVQLRNINPPINLQYPKLSTTINTFPSPTPPNTKKATVHTIKTIISMAQETHGNLPTIGLTFTPPKHFPTKIPIAPFNLSQQIQTDINYTI